MSVISIHAPLTGSDDGSNTSQTDKTIFQSTLPSQGATEICSGSLDYCSHFNPRSPHRERRSKALTFLGYDGFQSTLPSQGATYWGHDWSIPTEFQSTLPSQGATYYYAKCFVIYLYFNPRSPHRERRICSRNGFARRPYFNPRSPHRERQQICT